MADASNNATGCERWLICEISDQYFAMMVDHVTELVPSNSLTFYRPPRMPSFVEGIVELRGEPIAVVDMRSILGMNSMRQETDDIMELLHQREQDHVNWLNELSACVDNAREFRLAQDPHKCAFGKWYDKLMADSNAVEYFTNGDLGLREVLERFDPIHKRIHGIAANVIELSRQGDKSKANALIEKTQDGDLAEMVRLFEQARGLITKLRRGVIVVLDANAGRIGALVDAASEVRSIQDAEHRSVSMLQNTDSLVSSLVYDEECDRLIQLFDTKSIQEKCQPQDGILHT